MEIFIVWKLIGTQIRSLLKNKDYLFCVPPKCLATVGYLISPKRKLEFEKNSLTEADLINPPPSFPPSSTIRLHPREARELATAVVKNYGNGGISFGERQLISFASCHAMVFKTCREMEGPYCDYLEGKMRREKRN